MKKVIIFFIINLFFIINNNAQETNTKTAIFLDMKQNEIFRFNCKSITDMNDRFALYTSRQNTVYQKGVLNISNHARGVLDFINKEVILEASTEYSNLEFINDEEILITHLKDKKKELFNLITRKIKKVKKEKFISYKTYTNKKGQEYVNTTGENFIVNEGEKKYGLLNKKKKNITPIIYDAIIHLGDDFYQVEKNNKWGVLNKKGEVVLPTIYHDIEFLSDTSIWATNEKGQGQIWNTKGKPLTLKSYENLDIYFTHDITAVDTEGNSVVLDENYQEIVSRNDGIRIVSSSINYFSFSQNGRYGIMNKNGKIILPATYENVSLLDDKGYEDYWYVTGDYDSRSGVYSISQSSFVALPYYGSECYLGHEDDVIHSFYDIQKNIAGFHFRNAFFSGDYSGFAAAGKDYLCVYEHTSVTDHRLTTTPDTLYANPKYYPYPNVDFEYAVSYRYNIGENKSKAASFEHIIGDDGLAKSAKAMKRLEKTDFERLNTVFAPALILVVGDRTEAIPVSYCYIPRDAIVFYDGDDNPVATLEVCFECSHVKASNGMEFPSTPLNWRRMSELFGKLGHFKNE